MTKRNENEPDDKAYERFKEFNRQRQVPDENIEGATPDNINENSPDNSEGLKEGDKSNEQSSSEDKCDT